MDKKPRFPIGEVVAIAQLYSSIKDDSLLSLIETPGWTNKMFVKSELMPHQVKITDVKIERIQDISDEDCLKEGILIDKEDNTYYYGNSKERFFSPRETFASLFDKVSGKGTWNGNPLVHCYSFELLNREFTMILIVIGVFLFIALLAVLNGIWAVKTSESAALKTEINKEIFDNFGKIAETHYRGFKGMVVYSIDKKRLYYYDGAVDEIGIPIEEFKNVTNWRIIGEAPKISSRPLIVG